MQIEELVKLSSQKVRGNSDLMAIYINAFKEVFGKTPNCAGCTFSADFTKLKKVVLKQIPIQKTRKMADTTFKLKKKLGKIHSYKKNGRTIHFYDTNMTEEIAIEYLTYGTPEQIEKRKELFAVLPNLSEKQERESNDSQTEEELIKDIDVVSEEITETEKPKRGRKTKNQ